MSKFQLLYSCPKTNVKVSVVIPCYNYGHFLNEAIESCLNSTFKDIEIIVVNDGSTDSNTIKILNNIDNFKIRVIHQENQGLGAARNSGIREAKGEYILPLDADDKIHPTLIEKEYKILKEKPELGFVTHWTEAFGIEDFVWDVPCFDVETLLKRNIVCVTSLFRKNAWIEAGGYNEQMSEQGFEDWDFWISIVENGWSGYTIPEILFYYRRHGRTMFDNANEKYDKLYKEIKNNHKEIYKKYGLY